MNRGSLVGFAVAAGVGVGMWYASRSSAPAVFEDVSMPEALARSEREGNWLVVKLTASWCPPCKTMDKTTFSDGRVVDWIKSHGSAIVVDVDKHRDTAAELGVRGVPTTVLYKGGKEVARVSGAVPPEMFVMWLERGGD